MKKEHAIIRLKEKTTLLEQCEAKLLASQEAAGRVPELLAQLEQRNRVIATMEFEAQLLTDTITRVKAALTP